MYHNERATHEVDELLNQLAEDTDLGEDRYPGMTYAQGVEAGVRWLLGLADDHPYEE